MNREEFLKSGVDLRRLVLYFQKKIWIILLLILIGAGLGALVYQVVRSLNMPVEYNAVSKLYISFAYDEGGTQYQHYNGYTWNELIDTDPIMDCVMNYLPGYSRITVQMATKAEIISDIRLLTVTVTGNNEKFTREVQAAMEAGLQDYAQKAEEIRSITTIRSFAPERIYWVDHTTTSCIAGAVIAGVVSILIFSFLFVLNEAFYVQSDIEKRYPFRALGITTRNQKGMQPYNQELKACILHLLKDKKNLVFIDVDDHAKQHAQDFDRLLNWDEGGSLGNEEDGIGKITWHVRESTDEDELFEPELEKEWNIVSLDGSELTDKECELIRSLGPVVITVPFGMNSAPRKLERILSLMKNQDLTVLGIVITEADEEYLNRYYA
ncbi:MAG: hypothetical protein K6F53_00965 [Lachnospiraceae bacterium]|nr:hypothetical protein [Lachnospiraceae bacterium]